MEYRRLGKSGLKVSALSFGSWVSFSNQMGVAGALECMTAAYDAGVNFFDNAESYAQGQSEIIMGEQDLYAEVSGTIKLGNTETPANLVWAAVTAYDDSGVVVGSRRWEAGEVLEPGAEIELYLNVYSLSRPIDQIEIIVEARP